MLLKGNQRAGGAQLARHLLNADDNEHVELHDIRGFVSDDLDGAFRESHALSKGTRCKQFLFSLSLNPPEMDNVPIEVFEQAIERIEQKLGLKNQPRAIVFHEKESRRHAHCVWSRIKSDDMKAINLPHYKLKLQDLSRQIYLEQGWDMPKGFIDKESRDPLNFSQAEWQQAKRTRQDPKELKELFQSAWKCSDSCAAFVSALKEHGFILARGNRRGHVAVDTRGEVYAISRYVSIKAKDVRQRLGDLKTLPSVEEALVLARECADTFAQVRLAEKETPLKAQLEALLVKRHALTVEHRKARHDLKNVQARREIDETKRRAAHLPTGLRALWSGVTGKYKLIQGENERDFQACQQRDRKEYEHLIQLQRRQRRRLQYEIVAVRHQQSLLKKHSRRDKRPAHTPDPAQHLTLPNDPELRGVKQKVNRSPDSILGVLSDKIEFFTRDDILRGLADYIDDAVKLQIAIDQVFGSKELVCIDSGKKRRYTTRTLQAQKQSLLENVRKMDRSIGFGVKNSHLNDATNHQDSALQKEVGAKLSAEQRNAIFHVVNEKQISCAIGLAGAGKSTMLSAANSAWQKQGLRVIGSALSGKAADGLQKASNIQSRTLASWELSWKHDYHRLQKGDVLVIDEAGMVGLEQMERLVSEVKNCGAKLVLVGDPEQLQPIAAGTPFRDIAEHVETATLTEIHRQKNDWQKQATRDLSKGHIEDALLAYAENGHVEFSENTDEAIATLVEDYMGNLEQHGDSCSRLALAHRRVDVHAINQAIRRARKSLGELSNETLVKTAHGKRAFASGDRVVFTKNDKNLGVRNGSLGTLTKVDEDSLTVEFDQEDSEKPRRLKFSLKEYDAVDHGYATTIHKSQGMTVDDTFVLSSNTMDRHLAYVAMTRHKRGVKLYMDSPCISTLDSTISRSYLYERNGPKRS